MVEQHCRYGVLVLVASLVAGQDADPVECEEEPTHLIYVASNDDGISIEFSVAVCPEHEDLVSQNPGYKRSIKLRSRPDSATASLAADS